MFLLGFLAACHGQKDTDESKQKEIDAPQILYVPKYAQGFTLQSQGDEIILVVKSDKHEAMYPLPRKERLSLVSFSTSHIGYLEQLSGLEALKGFGGTRYVSSKTMKQQIQDSTTIEVGDESHPSLEKILKVRPNYILTSFPTSDQPMYQKITASPAGIKTITIGEWKELDPLGRAEWIVAFAAILGDWEAGTKAFQRIEQQYQELLTRVPSSVSRKKIISNLGYKGNWYASGGQSYMAKFIEQAGGEYLFQDIDGGGAQVVSLERFLTKAMQADIWLNPSSATTRAAMLDVEPRVQQIFDRGISVWNNTKAVADDANPFYELSPVAPHLVLADLIAILQDSNDSLYFYQKVE